jgi:glutamate-1-semialdehyde 2,1-aminomutase
VVASHQGARSGHHDHRQQFQILERLYRDLLTMPDRLTFENSRKLCERMRRCEALVDAKPGLFFGTATRIGGYPLFVERAAGAELWDVDGNHLIDYLLGFGSVVLGHADHRVETAVAGALASGPNPTLLNLFHLELAESLVALLPGIELVTFLRTGSDAIAAAVRLARAVTGRQRVLHWGMHGWHDWCTAANDGVLSANAAVLHRFEYNNLADAERLFALFPGEIACIAMMPYEFEMPHPGYLQGLRDMAHRNGALFVLDEVRSGFRIDLGGAQARFGVDADLCAYSKAIANGHALSVLGGKRAIMQEILKLGLTVTFYRAPDPMAAALATIGAIREDAVPDRLELLGKRLQAGLTEVFASAGLPGHAIGHPATPFITFAADRPAVDQRMIRRFSNGMLERGYLMPCATHWFICAAMTEAMVDQTIAAAYSVAQDMAQELK